MNYYNADTVIEQDREIYRLRLALETATARIASLERQRSEFDCRYAGPYAETSGVHCAMGQPCQSCQLAAAERERDEARAKLAGVIAERDRFAPFSDDLPVEPLSRHAPPAAPLDHVAFLTGLPVELNSILPEGSIFVHPRTFNGLPAEKPSWLDRMRSDAMRKMEANSPGALDGDGRDGFNGGGPFEG